MNLLKKFIRDPGDDYGSYDDGPYIDTGDLGFDMSEGNGDDVSAALNSPARKEPELHPASADRVALKLLQPKSHTEATRIADKLKEGCIVLLDISNLTKEKALRLVDFLAGVAYVVGGEMIKTNKNTIVVAPAGVDISNFAQEETPVEAPAAEPAYEEAEDAVVEEFEEI